MKNITSVRTFGRTVAGIEQAIEHGRQLRSETVRDMCNLLRLRIKEGITYQSALEQVRPRWKNQGGSLADNTKQSSIATGAGMVNRKKYILEGLQRWRLLTRYDASILRRLPRGIRVWRWEIETTDSRDYGVMFMQTFVSCRSGS